MRRSQRSYGFTGGRRSRSAATLHHQQQQRRPQSARPAGRGRSGSEEGYVHSLEAQIDELRSTLAQLQDTAQLSQQQQQYQQAVVPPELEAKVDQLAKVRHGV